MELNRRKFLNATTGLATSVLYPTFVSAQPPGGANRALRIRKDVSTLDANSPDIVALKDAIKKMKAGLVKPGQPMGETDGRRWAAQAGIHGTFTQGFGACKHASWYFLPWHRVYLYHFEEIIRELSANEDFALPYWDWTRNRTLSALFWGADNPLSNPARPAQPGSGRRAMMNAQTEIPDDLYNRFMSQTVISRILAIEDFETFAGSSVANPGDEGIQGRLEGAPHNQIHNWVSGDMATGGSPYDPIFWLHHCNVDRLWTEWARRHSAATPSDGGWLKTNFSDFYGRNGQQIEAAKRIRVEQTLATEELGYQYDRRQGPVPVMARPTQPAPQVFSSLRASDPRVVDDFVAFAPRATAEFATKVNAVVSQAPFEDEASRRTVRLRIKGIKAPDDPSVMLDVFLNCQKLNPNTPISDPSYVGSSSFFMQGRHGHDHGERKGDGTVAFAFDLTPEFVQLYGDRPLKADEPLQVAIIARHPAVNGRRPTPAEILTLRPEQVSIEVVGRPQ